MVKMKLLINEKIEIVDPIQILEIKNGKALLKTKRWYDIVCDCLESKDYETVFDSEAPGGNGYIVCNYCNKTHYLSDLKNMQEDIQ